MQDLQTAWGFSQTKTYLNVKRLLQAGSLKTAQFHASHNGRLMTHYHPTP